MNKLTPEQLTEIAERCKEVKNASWTEYQGDFLNFIIEKTPALLDHTKALEEENKQQYEKGRMDEAEITLGNMKMILEEMTEQPHKNSHILTCIRDLEEALKGGK